MQKIMRMVTMALIGATVTLGACTKADGSSSRTGTVQDKGDSTYQHSVMERLHTQHMLAIPEVKAQSDIFVQKYRSGSETREDAAKEFSAWLDDFASKNPEKVKAVQSLAATPQPTAVPAPAQPPVTVKP
jgi:hypothetical protein